MPCRKLCRLGRVTHPHLQLEPGALSLSEPPRRQALLPTCTAGWLHVLEPHPFMSSTPHAPCSGSPCLKSSAHMASSTKPTRVV